MKAWKLREILTQRLLEEACSDAELSRRTGIVKCSLQRFLRGGGGLSLATIEKLMQRYGLVVIEKPKRRKGR